MHFLSAHRNDVAVDGVLVRVVDVANAGVCERRGESEGVRVREDDGLRVRVRVGCGVRTSEQEKKLSKVKKGKNSPR